MDKSESELLADWDVVSSVYDTEQEKNVTDKKADTSLTNTKDSIKSNTNSSAENKVEPIVKNSETEESGADTTTTDLRPEDNAEKTSGTGGVSVKTSEASAVSEPNDDDAGSEQTSEADDISELDTVIESHPKVDAVAEQKSEIDDIVEQIPEIDFVAEESTKQTEVKTEIEPMEMAAVNTEEAIVANRKATNENIEKIDATDLETNDDDTNKNLTASDKNTSAGVENNAVYIIGDHAANSSLDSSIESIHIEHCGGSRVQDTPELIDLVESSSSDIDIIDENMEESISSSFVHPLSISISSSVDTSSVLMTPPECDKQVKAEQEAEDNAALKTESWPEKSETFSKTVETQSSAKTDSYTTKPDSHTMTSESFQESRHEKRDESTQRQSQRSPSQPATSGIFAVILQFLRNMTHFEWSILGGVVICLYVTIVFNQTNIFAVVERENVVSQMKKMIDELKIDNKILKDQMISEMKNEKVFSSFEHQIKELKKENSKLNHMLYDVVKVLEEQKDSHEMLKKRESENVAPFKKEINKLKEHINILKFDNEELQKQLVRMRYASYSQGGGDASGDKTKEPKQETKSDETSSDEVTLDINSLKKWNELVTLLSKELGLLAEDGSMKDEKPHSDIRNNISWYWKVFLKEFKGTFKDFKENVTSIISDYKQANEKTVSEIYKFVKDFFTVEENNQQFIPPDTDNSQWKNIGDFVTDLKEKWSNIKERIYTSDLKNFIKNFQKLPEESDKSEKVRSSAYESYESKPINVHFDYEKRPTNFHSESEKKHEKVQSESEDSKWMFKRAEHRAELRDTKEEDPSDNWFLKRKKRVSDDELGDRMKN